MIWCILFLLLPGNAFNLSNSLSKFQDRYNIPGIAVALVNKTSFHYTTLGYANLTSSTPISPKSIFQYGSITKLFTTALILNRGWLVKNRVCNYLSFCNLCKDIRNVTLFQLLTHTSGLPKMPPNKYSRKDIQEYLCEWKKISGKWKYSNLGYALLSWTLQDSPRTYLENLNKTFLVPMKMMSTSFGRTKNLVQGYNYQNSPILLRKITPLYGSGYLRGSLDNLRKFLQGNLGKSSFEKIFWQMRQPHYQINENVSMGYGWLVLPDIIEKDGVLNGFSSYLGVSTRSHRGIVILLNKKINAITNYGRYLLRQRF